MSQTYKYLSQNTVAAYIFKHMYRKHGDSITK